VLSVSREDRGAYTCRAYSIQGEAVHTTRLLVQGEILGPSTPGGLGWGAGGELRGPTVPTRSNRPAWWAQHPVCRTGGFTEARPRGGCADERLGPDGSSGSLGKRGEGGGCHQVPCQIAVMHGRPSRSSLPVSLNKSLIRSTATGGERSKGCPLLGFCRVGKLWMLTAGGLLFSRWIFPVGDGILEMCSG